MDFQDVLTVSPIGINKTFGFSNPKVVDASLTLEKDERVCWDPHGSSTIFCSTVDHLKKISLIDGQSVEFQHTSYLGDASSPVGISADGSLLVIGKASGAVSIFDTESLAFKSQINVGKNLTVCKFYSSYLMCGGKENIFSVWDIHNLGEPLFTAKNVRPDTLDLRVPIWLSDASFVHGYESSLFLTTSKYGDFSLYDVRSGQRRPVCRSAWRISRKQGKTSVGTGKHPAMLRDLSVTRPVTRVVAFASGPGVGLRAVAGNAIGDLCLLDFRVPRFCLATTGETDDFSSKRHGARSVGAWAPEAPTGVHTFVPATGSISGIFCGGAGAANLPHALPTAVINDQPIVISSSIDRFLRVYNRDTGDLLLKTFVKTPISTFLLRASARFPLKSGDLSLAPDSAKIGEILAGDSELHGEAIAESDAIWDSMHPVAVKTLHAHDALKESAVGPPKKKKKKNLTT